MCRTNAAPELIIVLPGEEKERARVFHTAACEVGTSVHACSGKPEERFVKMFSWRVSGVGVGPIFNINQEVNSSFVNAGAFIRPWLFYTSG